MRACAYACVSPVAHLHFSRVAACRRKLVCQSLPVRVRIRRVVLVHPHRPVDLVCIGFCIVWLKIWLSVGASMCKHSARASKWRRKEGAKFLPFFEFYTTASYAQRPQPVVGYSKSMYCMLLPFLIRCLSYRRTRRRLWLSPAGSEIGCWYTGSRLHRAREESTEQKRARERC